MLYFLSDYQEGAHPLVLKKLLDTNMECLPGYGDDKYCESAAEKIKAACNCPGAEIRFLTGGTQTNAVVIDMLTQPYEGVIAADTGHISVHESGAVEFTGHKVLTIPNSNGKLEAQMIEKYLEEFYADDTHEHMVPPGLVYITHPTEMGTLYSKQELKDISDICRKYGLKLYLDGARMAYGLASRSAELTLPDIAELCDAFYIGGTKCGALSGEAVVFTPGNFPKAFLTQQKRHTALLAKGRLYGVQFDALFTDGLYYELGKNAIETAEKLKALMLSKGYALFVDSPTNQQFIVMENSKVEELAENVAFEVWSRPDPDHTAVRFCTSWATTAETIDKLAEYL